MAQHPGGWAAHPDAGSPDAILVLEVFGRLVGAGTIPPIGEGVLWSAFRTRAEMMGWERDFRGASGFWSTHEAELTLGMSTHRIGWVQVGIESGSSPVPVIPALVRCLDDALGRFGLVESSALQLTASHLPPSTATLPAALVSWLAWFDASPAPGVQAVLAFDGRVLRTDNESDLLDRLSAPGSPSFRIGPLAALAPEQRIEVPSEAPLNGPLAPALRGIRVHLPEWSATAAGWVLAAAVDAARALNPARELAVRLSRFA